MADYHSLTRSFPNSTARMVSQTGAVLAEDPKGLDIILHFAAGAVTPHCAELVGAADLYAEIGLEWSGRTLTGYDGCFDIPQEIETFLKDLGFAIDL